MLAQPASDPHDRAVRWRQLVELVARAGEDSDSELVEAAIARIRADCESLDERVRVAAALAVAPLPLPADLVAAFAADTIAVAAPVLTSARLTASEWKRVTSQASADCRELIATMRSEQEPADPAPPTVEQRRGPDAAIPSISDVVARVERLLQSREADSTAPQPQVDEASGLFRWECNESGEIDWVEGVPRGALVGHSIAQARLESGVDTGVQRAFSARAPFHDGVLELASDGAIGGTWKISGVPAFERKSGRFAGYRGIAERPDSAGKGPSPDSIRELAHEIRTPLNAIMGFADIITGEHLGPAESRYRERASEIAAQARLLLTAVEDLDLAARLRSTVPGSSADLSECLALAWEEVDRNARLGGVRINAAGGDEPALCALDPSLAQRLVERFSTAVVGSAGEGEMLTFRIATDDQCCVLSVNRPSSLEGADLRPDRNRRSSDTASLPLRLVMGLARTAGGELESSDHELSLRLPKA